MGRRVGGRVGRLVNRLVGGLVGGRVGHSSKLHSPFSSRSTVDPFSQRHTGASSSSSSPEDRHSLKSQSPFSSRSIVEPSKHTQTTSSLSAVGEGVGRREDRLVGGRVSTGGIGLVGRRVS